MNSVAFLAMLASFAVVMGWYAWSHERGTDGRDGLLGIRTGEEEAATERRPGHALRNVRAGRTEAATTLTRVRERARAANAGGRTSLRARARAEERRADPDRGGA